jgi:hypothetical protein
MGLLNTLFDSYRPVAGNISMRENGSLVAFETGQVRRATEFWRADVCHGVCVTMCVRACVCVGVGAAARTAVAGPEPCAAAAHTNPGACCWGAAALTRARR